MSKKHRRQSVAVESTVVETPVDTQVVSDTPDAQVVEIPAPVVAKIMQEAAAELAEAAPVVEAQAAAVQPLDTPTAPATQPATQPKARAYPREGGKCWQVWNAMDNLLASGTHPTVKHAREIATQENWNVSNASQEFYAWRKFRGRV